MPLSVSAICGPSAFRLPQGGSVVDFAEQYHRITVGSLKGLYNRRNATYQVRAFDAWNDPAVEKITLVWPSQIGKSTVGEVLIHYIVANDPDPILVVLPETKARNHYVKQRMQKAINESPNFRDHLAGGVAITNEEIRFTTCTMTLALSDSSSDLSQKSIRYVILEERDKFKATTTGEGSPAKQAAKRQRSFTNAKTLQSGTPVPDSENWDEYLQSSMEELQAICPHCHEGAPWHDDHIRHEEIPDGTSKREFAQSLDEGAGDVWYECPRCHEDIPETLKARMNDGEYWLAARPWIKKHIGLHTHSLCYPLTTFRKILVERLQAEADIEEKNDDRAMQDFVQHQRATPYKMKGSALAESAIVERVVKVKKGIVPAQCRFVTRGIDVQHGRLIYVVKGWGDNMKAHVVDWGSVDADLTTSFKEFDEIIAMKYLNEKKEPVPCRATFVDSGDGPMSSHVYAACNRPNMPGSPWTELGKSSLFRWGVRPSKGFDELPSGQHWGTTRGRDHGDKLVRINTMRVKEFNASLMARPPDHPCALTFAAEARDDTEFQRQIVSEELRTERTKSRNVKKSWQLRPGYQANHYLDASIYADAGAICATGFRNAPKPVREELRIKRMQPPTYSRRM